MDSPTQQYIVYLVHGTWGGPKGRPSDSEMWFSPESPFVQSIRQYLDRNHTGMSDRISFDSYVWSGRNSFTAREEAARHLFAKLCVRSNSDHSNSDQKVILIGHSHGGNVINDAFAPFGEPAMNRLVYLPTKVAGIVTMATPFLARTLTTSRKNICSEVYTWMVLPLLAALIAVAAGSALLHHGMYHSGGVFLTLGLLALGGLGHAKCIFLPATFFFLKKHFSKNRLQQSQC